MTETRVDLHKYLVLDPEAQDLLFREARTPNIFTDELVTDAQLEAGYELLRFAPTSMNQPLARMVVVRSDVARARLVVHMWERDRGKMASAPVSVVLAADLDFHENLPVLFPHVPNAGETFADPVARAESAPVQRDRAGRLLRPRGPSGGLAAGPLLGFDAAGVDREFFPDGRRASLVVVNLGRRVPTRGCPACRASRSTKSSPSSG